ncbi:15807_t:CDS:1, partial [Funneliformis geosporum]
MNDNDDPVEPVPPVQNKSKKIDNKFTPTSVDSNVTLVNNDRSTCNLEEPTVQKKGNNKFSTKEQYHIAHDSNERVTNKESNKERYLTETETDPIQTKSKVRMRENELEREQKNAKKVKLLKNFGQLSTVSIQPKSKDVRMREHDLEPREVVKKAKLVNESEDSENRRGSTSQTISQNNN